MAALVVLAVGESGVVTVPHQRGGRGRLPSTSKSCEVPAPPGGPLPPREQPTIRLQIARRHSESGDHDGCVALAATAGALWTTWSCLASAASVSLLLRHAVSHEPLAPIKEEAEEQQQYGLLEKEKRKEKGKKTGVCFLYTLTRNVDFKFVL